LNEMLGNNAVACHLGDGNIWNCATRVAFGGANGWADCSLRGPSYGELRKRFAGLPGTTIRRAMLKNLYRLSRAASARERMRCLVYDSHGVPLLLPNA
jgi:hypothetical protein